MFNLEKYLRKLLGGRGSAAGGAWQVITRQQDGQTHVGVVDHDAISRFQGGNLQPVVCELEWRGQSGASHTTERIQEFEGQVIKIIGGRGEYLGRLGAEGRHTLFLSVPKADDNLFHLLAASAEAAGFSSKCQPSQLSPRAFAAQLLPDPAEKRRLADLMVLHELLRRDDDLLQARPVEHRIYFPDRPSAEAFAGRVAKAGYQLDPVMEDLGEFCLVLKHDCAMTEEISDHSISLSALALEMGGDYDGWETEVRPKNRPESVEC